MILRVPDAVLGEVATAGNPLKGNALPPVAVRAAPQLGADSERVLAEWLAGRPIATSTSTGATDAID